MDASFLACVTKDPVLHASILLLVVVCVLTVFYAFTYGTRPKSDTVYAYAKFAYSCFIKPHTGDNNGSQQEALESFYKTQATIYDRTRGRLLRGREDMLGLAASHLQFRQQAGGYPIKPVWVDVSRPQSSVKAGAPSANFLLLRLAVALAAI